MIFIFLENSRSREINFTRDYKLQLQANIDTLLVAVETLIYAPNSFEDASVIQNLSFNFKQLYSTVSDQVIYNSIPKNCALEAFKARVLFWHFN